MIDWNLPIQLRDGRKAKLVYVKGVPATDRETHIVSFIGADGFELVREYFSDGRYSVGGDCPLDAINVLAPAAPVEGFFNVYLDSVKRVAFGEEQKSLRDALSFAFSSQSGGKGPEAVAVVKFTFVNGRLDKMETVWER